MSDPQATCELTDGGNLRLTAALAQRYFPAGVCVAAMEGEDLVLLPLHGEANGGLVLKQRNAAGDRSLLVSEVLGFQPRAGRFPISWHEDRGALVVALRHGHGQGAGRERHSANRGRGGLPPVGRLPAADRDGGRRAPAPVGTPQRARGAVDRVARAARGASPAAPAAGGSGRLTAGAGR